MIEGTLNIHWDNSDAPSDTRMYKVSFEPNAPAKQATSANQNGQAYKEVLGDESLVDYLIQIQPAGLSLDRRAERAEAWVAAVHKEGHHSLEKVALTDEQVQGFSAA
jgi:hypothetical protein